MRCSTCSNPQVDEIDRLLSTGTSIRKVSRLYGLARSSVGRHREHSQVSASKFALIRGQADPLAASFELAARATTERERLKSLEAIRGATALLLRGSQGAPDAEAVRQLDRNVHEAAAAFRSGSASFEQSIRALQGVREAVRQRLDARAPGDVETRLLVTWPGSDPEAEGTPVRLRAGDYWQGIPSRFHDVAKFRAERVVRLRFGAVRREAGDPPDQEIKVRETATGALVWASERAVAGIGGDQ